LEQPSRRGLPQGASHSLGANTSVTPLAQPGHQGKVGQGDYGQQQRIRDAHVPI